MVFAAADGDEVLSSLPFPEEPGETEGGRAKRKRIQGPNPAFGCGKSRMLEPAAGVVVIPTGIEEIHAVQEPRKGLVRRRVMFFSCTVSEALVAAAVG